MKDIVVIVTWLLSNILLFLILSFFGSKITHTSFDFVIWNQNWIVWYNLIIGWWSSSIPAFIVSEKIN